MLLCTRSIVLCAMFCRSLFVLLFLFWPILNQLRTSLFGLQRRSLICFHMCMTHWYKLILNLFIWRAMIIVSISNIFYDYCFYRLHLSCQLVRAFTHSAIVPCMFFRSFIFWHWVSVVCLYLYFYWRSNWQEDEG